MNTDLIYANVDTFLIDVMIAHRIYHWKRTSDGGNGNHSVSLPIILIKNKVDQKFPSSYISLLLVSFFLILHLISFFHKCTALFWG